MIGPRCVEYSVSTGTFLPDVHIKKLMRGRYQYYHLARINAPSRTVHSLTPSSTGVRTTFDTFAPTMLKEAKVAYALQTTPWRRAVVHL